MPDRTLQEWLRHIDSLHPHEIEMGLERVRTVAERLNVRRPAPLSIIIAGTNGKGSTAVFTEALLIEAGYRVGTTLSPHIETFNERVRVDGSACDDATLCANFAVVDAARGEIQLTYFEFAALVALVSFRDADVDVAILEVGLGGRLDAFNIVDADIAVVTSIGLDHEDYLGRDLEQIGREKAGVFRPGQTVVLGESVTSSVCDRARELGCRIANAGSQFSIAQSAQAWSFQSAELSLQALPHGTLAAENCATALGVALRVCERAAPTAGLDRQLVLRALERASLPGRFETIQVDDRRYVLDVAHNAAGAKFLHDQLARRVQVPLVAIVGSLRDKDTGGIIGALRPVLQRLICVGVDGPRGLEADELAARINTGIAGHHADCAHIDNECAPDLARAVIRARSLTRPGDAILAFGSFAIVGRARTLLEARSTVAADGHC